MLSFITENIGTIAVLLVLVLVVGAVITKMVRDKKSGKSSCGCDCSNCSANCHSKMK